MRQTFLTFPTITQAVQRTEIEPPKGQPRPPPELPAELWCQILDALSTISLKSFRLVCRGWSLIAAPRLFSTAYLDGYALSWSRLLQLCHSQYASLVTSIVWTPLVMSCRSLDSALWRAEYPNLNKGLTHSESVRLHAAYRQTYNEFRREDNLYLQQDKAALADGLKRLTNCVELLLLDDTDIETRCTDVYLRRRIQNDDLLLAKVSIWGRCPRMWKLKNEDNQILKSANYLEVVTANCKSLRTATVNLWDHHWQSFNLFRSFQYRYLNPQAASVTVLTLQLKFYEVYGIETDQRLISQTIAGSYCGMMCLPSLQDLRLKFLHTNPGPEFVTYYKERLRGNPCDNELDGDGTMTSSTLESSSIPNSTVTSLEYVGGAIQTSLGRAYRAATYTIIRPSLLQYRNLRSLTLRNVALDTRVFLAWICEQTRPLESRFTLRVEGHSILYGLCPRIFLRALSHLNVEHYNSAHTVYYETPQVDDYECLHRWHIAAKDGMRCSITIEPELNHFGVGDFLEDPSYTSRPMPSSSKTKISIPSVTFVHRPLTIKDIVPTIEHNESESATLYYCLHHNRKHSKFEWIDRRTYASLPRPEEVHILLTADMMWTNANEFEWNDVVTMNGMILEQTLLEVGEQGMLQCYENELLRLDVVPY